MKRSELTIKKYVKATLSLMLCGALVLGGTSIPAKAETADAVDTAYVEVEENGTQNEATKMELNTTYVGNTSSTDDVDWYEFTIPEGSNGYFNVTVEPDASADVQKIEDGWEISVYKKGEASSLLFVEDIEAKCVTQEMPYEPGVYYVMITVDRNNAWTEEQYNIRVDYISTPNWESEYNNDASQADVIDANQTYYGNLLNDDDEDWYEFTLSEYGKVVLSIGADESEDLTKLGKGWDTYIYRANDADSFEAIEDAKGVSNTVDLYLSAGKYRILVNAGWDGNDGNIEGKGYNLRVNYTPGGDIESELNDSMQTANEIRAGVTYTGNMKYENNDKDYYVFTASLTGNLTLNFNRDVTSDTGAGYDIAVLDSDNKTLAEVEEVTSESTSVGPISVTAGAKYYIYVGNARSNSQITGVNYHFSFAVIPMVVEGPAPIQTPPADEAITKTKVSVNTVKAKKTKVFLKWKRNKKATGYKIYRSMKKKGAYKCIKTIKKAKTTSYYDKKVKKGKTYFYKIRAYRKSGKKTMYSGFSPVKRVKVK